MLLLRELIEGKGELVALAAQHGEAGLGTVALLEHAADLSAQSAQAAFETRGFICGGGDFLLRLRALTGERSRGGLLFLHAPELAREHVGDLRQLRIGVVKLRFSDAQTLLGARDFGAVALREAGKFEHALLVENDPVFVIRDARAQFVHGLAGAVELLLHLLQRGTLHGHFALLLLDLLLVLRLPGGE